MIRFGIIGAGGIAHKFADAVSEVGGAVLSAVASKSKLRAEEFAKEHGIPNRYGSYEELLRRDDIDAVYIATTMNYHFDNILECLRHDKHVLCEKCMVMSARDAETVIAEARRRKRFLMECMWVRFLPKVRRAKQWIYEGRIGRLKLAQGTLGFNAPFDPDSRLFSPALGGGALFDLGVYLIEVLGYFADRGLTGVSSSVIRAATGVDETVNLNLAYGDYLVNAQCSIAAKLPENGYVYGEDGYIEFECLHLGSKARLYGRDRELVEEFDQGDGNGFVYQIEEAVRCIEAGRTESATAPLGMTLECARIFDACLG